MKKLCAVLPLVIATTVTSEPLEYESIVNKMQVDNAGNVRFSMLLREEDHEILCDEQGYQFSFVLNNTVMDKWYDTLILARSANSLLNIHYDQLSGNNCDLTAITLPQLYDRATAPGEDPTGGVLKETGNYGNVALTGTNGLNSSSFEASQFYGQDSPQAAFDGYIYSEKSNADAEDKIGRGIWLVKKEFTDGRLDIPWIQVDFGKQVEIIGTRLFVNKKSLELGRSPRNVTILTSEDGEEFTKLNSFVLSANEVSSTAFAAPVEARYFRMTVESNHGDAGFIEIDEWEFYQPQN